jgi:serine/threonine protein kinase
VASVEIPYFAGHYALWQAGVLHRDVSPGNLMWYWGEDGTLVGVLNDYDLSSLATVQGPEGNERTGTVPFMAIDLLTEQGQRGEVKHLYRHDLESFMWVLVWVSFRYKDGRLLSRKSRRLDLWATVPAEDCGKEKVFFLSQLLDYKLPDIDPRMSDLVVDCCQALKREGDRRQDLKFRQRRGQVVIEEIELDDAKFLNLFTSATSWVQLKEGLS